MKLKNQSYPNAGGRRHDQKSINLTPFLRFRHGPVVQPGMNAALARRRPWVQIPAGPLLVLANKKVILTYPTLQLILTVFQIFNYFLAVS